MKTKAPKEQKTILLVEDDPSLEVLGITNLEKIGYHVITANTGVTAIQTVDQNPEIDLILMDINLGHGIDGTEAAKIILSRHNIPLVFLSSHTEKEIVEKTEQITSYGYIVKQSGLTVLDVSLKMAFKLFEANQNLRETNNKLKATLDALPDILFEIGLDGYIYDYRASRSDLKFSTVSEIVGKNIHGVLPDCACNTFQSGLKEATDKGYSRGMQCKWTTKSDVVWFEISVSQKPGDPTNPRFIVICHNITDRKIAEDKLIESENLLNEAQSLAKTGSWSWKIETDEVSWSKTLYDILGYDSNQPPPKYSDFNSLYSQDSLFRLRIAVEKAIRIGHAYDLKLEMIHSNGSIINTNTKGKAEKDDNGKIVRLHGTVQLLANHE